MTKLGTLNVVVAYNTFKTEGPNGVRRTTTAITVRMGDVVFATRTVGGRYSQNDCAPRVQAVPQPLHPRRRHDGGNRQGNRRLAARGASAPLFCLNQSQYS